MCGRGIGGVTSGSRPVVVDTSPEPHSAYADEDADLVIQTSDNVIFRVQSYYLKASSTFFRSMPAKDDIPSSSESPDVAVHIDAHSHPFRLLLDLVTGARTDRHLPFDYELIEQTMDLGERYGFTNLPQTILPFMQAFADCEAWSSFVFAAKNDFPMLAAYAIDKLQLCHEFRHVGILNIDLALLDGIPSKYAGPLVRNMTLFRQNDGKTDWRKVSQNLSKLEPDAFGTPIPALRRQPCEICVMSGRSDCPCDYSRLGP